MKTFLVRNKATIIAVGAGAVASLVVTLIVLATVFFGYFHVQPQDAVDVTITPAEITGTKEDGSAITGFIIETDGTEYLVTDYWNPIVLNEVVAE